MSLWGPSDHVFGVTSSPHCCNFALKQTSTDDVDEFDSAAAQRLQKDFYTDGMFKP